MCLLKLLESVFENIKLATNVAHQIGELRLRVQNLNALGVRVVAHSEGTRDGVGVLDHLLDRFVEAVGHVVDRLVLGDGVLLFTGLLRLKVTQLGFVRQTVLELSKRGQQSRAVSFEFAILTAQAELDREPEALEIDDWRLV